MQNNVFCPKARWPNFRDIFWTPWNCCWITCVHKYVCMCVYVYICCVGTFIHNCVCHSHCRLSQRIHMRGLEAQRQVEALSGDWAHYWQKPRYKIVLTISMAYVTRLSIKCVTKISIECVVKISIECVINIVLCLL